MRKKLAVLPNTARRKTRSNHAVRIPVALAVAGALALDVAATMPNPAHAATELKTVTNDDKTASVRVPDGWTFARGKSGFISLTGPQGERVNLGAVNLAKNAAPDAPSAGALFALPYSASLKDKLTADFDGYAAKTGAPDPEVTYAAQIPTKNPQCARFLGGLTTQAGANEFEAIICSFNPDAAGIYKNITFEANVPLSLAAQDRPIVEAIAASYRVAPATFKRMVAPYTTPPAAAGARMPAGSALLEAQMIAGQTQAGVGAALHGSDCLDLGALRDATPWEMASRGC